MRRGESAARGCPFALKLTMVSLTVRDIMNPQLLYVGEDDPAELVRSKIVHFGVSGVPVLDSRYRAVGFVSLRDFAPDGKSMRVTSPAVTVASREPVLAAARKLVDTRLRRLVVVDDHGIAVGVVSAVDFVRTLLGLAPRHPASFEADCTSAGAFPDDR